MDYVQGSRHMLEMTRNLFEDVAEETDVRYQRVDKQLGTVSVRWEAVPRTQAESKSLNSSIAAQCRHLYISIVQIAHEEGKTQ